MQASMVFEVFLIGGVFFGLIAIPVAQYLVAVNRYRPPGNVVGPSYWGSYGGCAKEEASLRQIKLRKITFAEIITAGSSVYSKGKPVKSLRR